jgi:uncharacterized protein YciI
MPMFVLISRFQRPLDEVNHSFASHSAWVQRQYESGRFLVSGRREPPIGGIIVARASSEQELQEVLSTDPYRQKGLAEYDIFAFEATHFPKRSSAFEAFASMPLRELSPTQEFEGSPAHE